MSSKPSDAHVLIAGGGVAGSTLAILLGRRGFRVELFEKEKFPREKPCGEGLMPAGVAVLDRLGLAAEVGGAPFRGIRYHVEGVTAEGAFPKVNGWQLTGSAQRRLHLDHVLFRAAAAAPGVTAHTGARVEAPLCENGRVTGLLVENTPRRGRFVVAADGTHSRLRRALGLDVPSGPRRFGARAHFRLAPDREQPPWVDVFVRPGYELYIAPLPHRELLVAALADHGALGGAVEESFLNWCRAEPILAARLEGADQVTPLLCESALAARARSGVAPGIALLGDAAGSLDPITGGGMTHALLTAELLAEHLARGFECGDDWLAAFEEERRTLLRDYRRVTQMVLWVAERPRVARPLVGALRMIPGALSHLVGVAGGVRTLVGRVPAHMFPVTTPAVGPDARRTSSSLPTA